MVLPCANSHGNMCRQACLPCLQVSFHGGAFENPSPPAVSILRDVIGAFRKGVPPSGRRSLLCPPYRDPACHKIYVRLAESHFQTRSGTCHPCHTYDMIRKAKILKKRFFGGKENEKGWRV